MDFDENLTTARNGIISALHDMENRAKQAESSWTLNQLPTESEVMLIPAVWKWHELAFFLFLMLISIIYFTFSDGGVMLWGDWRVEW